MKWSEVINKKIIVSIFNTKSSNELSEERIARTVRALEDGYLKELDESITTLKLQLTDKEIIAQICNNIDESSK